MKRSFAGALCVLLLGLCAACGNTEPEAATTAPPTTVEETTMLQETIESIYYTVTARIHPDMPEFTFALIGEWTRVFSRKLTGEIDYDDPHLRESTNIREIYILEEDGTFRQWLDGFSTSQDIKDEPYGFELLDLNNDGYLDIRLFNWAAGPMITGACYFWLWDKKQEKFVQNRQLQTLSEDWQGFELDNGRIAVYSRWGGGVDRETAWYEYRNNTFVLVESMSETLLFEDEVKEAEGEPSAIHTIIKKLVNGKMKTVSDTTESWEESIQ